MPTKGSAPKAAANPTPTNAAASRWVTAAQHAKLMALMADVSSSGCAYPVKWKADPIDSDPGTLGWHYTWE